LPITDRQSNPAAAAVTAAGCRGFSATAELAVRSVFSAESIDCRLRDAIAASRVHRTRPAG